MDATVQFPTSITNKVSDVLGRDVNKLGRGNSDSESFDGILNAAVKMISDTNDYLHEAQKAEVAFATGELKSTHELAVIEQKANLSLQYTVAIKNAIISAYKEIMQMQI